MLAPLFDRLVHLFFVPISTPETSFFIRWSWFYNNGFYAPLTYPPKKNRSTNWRAICKHRRKSETWRFQEASNIDRCLLRSFIDFGCGLGTKLEPCWPPFSCQDGPGSRSLQEASNNALRKHFYTCSLQDAPKTLQDASRPCFWCLLTSFLCFFVKSIIWWFVGWFWYHFLYKTFDQLTYNSIPEIFETKQNLHYQQ